jgi:hypothetical protein
VVRPGGVQMMLAWPSMGLDDLEVGAAGQGEGGRAVPQVVQPDRGQALTADEPDEPAGQVPERVGTAAPVIPSGPAPYGWCQNKEG